MYIKVHSVADSYTPTWTCNHSQLVKVAENGSDLWQRHMIKKMCYLNIQFNTFQHA